MTNPATPTRPTPPALYCEDFALVPAGEHEGKPPIAFGRPVNLLSAASPAAATTEPQTPAYALVLNLDGRLYVRDLSGNTGLAHNGRPVAEAELRHDDRVRLGPTEYRVAATRFAPDTSALSGRPDAELVPTRGGPSHPLRPPVTLVGECEQADVRLPSNGAPDSCVMILRVGGGYWLWNLDPTLPLTLNGQPVTRAPLTNGSTLAVGPTEFHFRMRAPALPAAASTRPAPAAAPASPTADAAPAPAIIDPAPAAAPAAATPTSADDTDQSAIRNPQSAIPIDAPPPPAPPRNLPARRTPRPAPTQQEIDDEADGFKQWGPLAFAVAAADRPELHGAGSKKLPAATPEPQPAGLVAFTIKLLLVAIVLVGVAAGAYVAWRRWGH